MDCGTACRVGASPGSPLFEPRVETLVVSASLEQSRILLWFVREALADIDEDYRWLDSGQRLAVTHKLTKTKLRVLSSSGKRAMGLSQFSTIYADEPGVGKLGAARLCGMRCARVSASAPDNGCC